MTTKVNYLKDTTVQILKKRFKDIQTRLKSDYQIKLGDFREFVLDREPDFNCPEGYDKITAAWYGRTPDIRLTEIMQEYEVELSKISAQ